jgi:HK97 family phage prohead protease
MTRRDAGMRRLPALETKVAHEPVGSVEPDGTFSGYASLFDVVDLGRDRVRAGAFAASLARRGASGVRMLWQHDPGEPIGVWLALREDARGLFVTGRLAPAVARSREALALLRQGAVDGLSIGFRTARSLLEPKTGIRDLVEIDLWEISLVTFPMLPGARVARVKRAASSQLRLASTIRRAARRLR